MMQKLAQMMPESTNKDKDDVPWWLKYGARGLGGVGGIIAIFFGAWNCTSIIFVDIPCLLSGIWQILAAFLVVVIEMPCCCIFIDFVQNFSDMMERRPYWNKGALYVGLALPILILCRAPSSFIGFGLIFGTGVLYGLMALGKKASREEMLTNAAAPPENMSSNLVSQEQPPASSPAVWTNSPV